MHIWIWINTENDLPLCIHKDFIALIQRLLLPLFTFTLVVDSSKYIVHKKSECYTYTKQEWRAAAVCIHCMQNACMCTMNQRWYYGDSSIWGPSIRGPECHARSPRQGTGTCIAHRSGSPFLIAHTHGLCPDLYRRAGS